MQKRACILLILHCGATLAGAGEYPLAALLAAYKTAPQDTRRQCAEHILAL